MSAQDAYVERRVKGQVFGTSGEQSILRTLQAKNHAVRRLERIGRRTKTSVRTNKSTWAA